ncbi:protealysin inhibitor emfourin [Rhodoglobus sp.]
MKVQVWRSGGLLGRRIEWDVIVDEQPDPEQWYLLIAELPWEKRVTTNPMPDRYTYEIHCDPHEVVIPEQDLVGPWRELVDRVREANAQSEVRPDAAQQPSPVDHVREPNHNQHDALDGER